MLAEFIDKVAALARDACKVEIREIPLDPRKLLIRKGDTVEERDVPPPLRNPKLRGIPDVATVVQDPVIADEPEVYHDASAVVVALNRKDRREVATMPLQLTERFKLLQGLAGGKSFDPKDAVKLLRYRLAGTDIDGIVELLRRIDFQTSDRGAVTNRHGQESLGRSVEMAVSQAAEIPDEFVVQTPVFQNPGVRDFRAQVRVGLYIDVAARKIELGPIADELDTALFAAQEYVGKMLREALGDKVPIIQGTFSS